MKNITPQIYLLCFLLLACEGKVRKSDIIGKWQTVEFKAYTPQLSPTLIDGAKVESLSTVYSFRQDHTFSLKSNYNPNGIAGTYEFIADSNIIKISYPSEGDTILESFQIETLNNSTLKWKQDLGELGSLVMTMEKE